MYASGSTWVFNAAMKVARAIVPAGNVTSRYVVSAAELEGIPDIVKTHETDEAAAAILCQAADAILVSIRDPRDCVTSLMLYQRYRLAQALEAVERSANACTRIAADARTLLLRYEDGFIDDPATLDRIAASFGGRLADADRGRIFAETRREAVEGYIAGLAERPATVRDAASGDLVDPTTQWHSHHAHRSGEVGRWRHMLALAEVAIIEQRMQHCMAAFGYPMGVLPLARPVGSETLLI
jgi:hypothetical protein